MKTWKSSASLSNYFPLVAVLVLACLSAQAAVRDVESIGLTVDSLDQELDFFTKVLPFDLVSESATPAGAADDLLGLSGSQTRTADLRLGGEHVTLTEHLGQRGSPISPDSQSYDHWFQHIAIVVHDMDQAYEILRRHHVKHVSTAPQTLPDWNKNAAGIKAFYFRDPEEHVLEIIWFPPGKGDPKWQQPTDQLFLGIDHTAIVVSDTDRSLAYYRDRLGMEIVGTSENYGTEQEHLNQVFGARLRITALRGGHGPGIEFLEYLTPPGGRTLPATAKASDLVFWRTRLSVDHFDAVVRASREDGLQLVSRRVTLAAASQSRTRRTFLLRDPDGHGLEFVEEVSPSERASK
jgi:catechol 2,3-dioxygenase-like lactoylglutathione lyase family enzyme